MRRRSHATALARSSAIWLACFMLGCVSDLTVAAPESLHLADSAALGKLPSLSVSLGDVVDAPSITQPVGERAAAFFQPRGPIHLTEDAGGIVQRTLLQTLHRAGHRVIAEGGQAHIALRVGQFVVDAPRAGLGWEVIVRVRLTARVSAAPGDEAWDDISAAAERTLRTPWRPGVGTVEPVLQDCLEDIAALLARRPELAAALAKHAARGRVR